MDQWDLIHVVDNESIQGLNSGMCMFHFVVLIITNYMEHSPS
jgi:hypothetical protein